MGGETKLFLGGLSRALCMRFEDEFSADYADYAEESSEQFNSWRDLKSLFAINSYLCNLRNLLCMRFEEGVIRRLRRLRRRKTQEQFNSWRDSNHFAMNSYLCNLRNLRIRKMPRHGVAAFPLDLNCFQLIQGRPKIVPRMLPLRLPVLP